MKYISKYKVVVEIIEDKEKLVTIKFVKSGIEQTIPKNRFEKIFKPIDESNNND